MSSDLRTIFTATDFLPQWKNKKIVIPVEIRFRDSKTSLIVNYFHEGPSLSPKIEWLHCMAELLGGEPKVYYQPENWVSKSFGDWIEVNDAGCDDLGHNSFLESLYNKYGLKSEADAYRRVMVESAEEREHEPTLKPITVWIMFAAAYPRFEPCASLHQPSMESQTVNVDYCVKTERKNGAFTEDITWIVTKEMVKEESTIEDQALRIAVRAKNLTPKGFMASVIGRTDLVPIIGNDGKRVDIQGLSILEFQLQQLRQLEKARTHRTVTIFIDRNPHVVTVRSW